MSRPRLVKLVRDGVGRFLAATEGSCEVAYEPIVDREVLVRELRKKLIEEAAEYVLEPCVAELADVWEVIRALARLDLGLPGIKAVEVEALDKYHERGGFERGMGMYCLTTAVSRHERG